MREMREQPGGRDSGLARKGHMGGAASTQVSTLTNDCASLAARFHLENERSLAA